MAIRIQRFLLCTAAAVTALGLTFAALAGEAADTPRATGDYAEARILVMIRMEPAHFRPDVDYGDGYAGRAALAARQRVARHIARTHGLEVLSHWPMPAIGVECYVMQVPNRALLEATLVALEGDERAAWAQPLQTFTSRAYDDPLYDLQPAASAWQLHRLHEVATGRGVLIAQIDSGVEVEHPDLRGQVRSARNTVEQSRYVGEQHGTAVAGIIAARPNNGAGIVGVAPGARLLVLRGCRESEPGAAVCDSLSLAKALQLALDARAQVVNLSVGGPPDRLLAALLDVALERGATVVAAADSASRSGDFPASHAGVLAVADTATPLRGSKLAAAGSDVPTTLPGARWGLVSGASFSAAAVSGVAALLLELSPGAHAPQIDALLSTRAQGVVAGSLPAPVIVDACRSVSLAAGRCACNCTGEAASSISNPTGGTEGESALARHERRPSGAALH